MTEILSLLSPSKTPQSSDETVQSNTQHGTISNDTNFEQLLETGAKPQPTSPLERFGEVTVIHTETKPASSETKIEATPIGQVDLNELEIALSKAVQDQYLPQTAIDPKMATGKPAEGFLPQHQIPMAPVRRQRNQPVTAPQGNTIATPVPTSTKPQNQQSSGHVIKVDASGTTARALPSPPDVSSKTSSLNVSTVPMMKTDALPSAIAVTPSSINAASPALKSQQSSPIASQFNAAPTTVAPDRKTSLSPAQPDLKAAISSKNGESESREGKHQSKIETAHNAMPRHANGATVQNAPTVNNIVAPIMNQDPKMGPSLVNGGKIEFRHPVDAIAATENTTKLTSQSSPTQFQTPPMNSSQDAKHIAQQLGAQLTKQSDGTTVIRLNPEELGSVRMSMRNTDGVMAITILAERPETVEIMRRNIGDLAQEFNALGYTNLAFDFGDGGTAADSFGESHSPQIESIATTTTEPEHPITQRTNGTRDGRLDLRL